MPGIDSYSLDNYGLDGPITVEHQIGPGEIYRMIFNGTPQTSGTTPVEKMSVTLNRIGGEVKVSLWLSIEGGTTGYGRVYVNDVAVGTVKTATSSSSVRFDEIVPIKAGDTISIKIYSSNSDANRVFLQGASVFSDLITINKEGN